MKRIAGIYKIEINGKSYIGSSVNIYQRWKLHKTDLKTGRHANPHMQNAYNKYKEIKFELIKEVSNVSDDELRSLEALYIKLFNPEYNILDPVAHFQTKVVYLFDLNGTLLNTYPDVYTASEQLGISVSSIRHAAQENEQLTRTAGGFFWRYTDKISFLKDKRLHEIHVYNILGEYLKSFESSKDCASELNLPNDASSRINRVCRGLAASYQGYRFSYEKVDRLDNSKLLSIKCYYPIVQIALDRKTRLNVFETASAAAKALNLKQNSITTAANTESKYKEFYWTRLGTKWSELLESPEDIKTTE